MLLDPADLAQLEKIAGEATSYTSDSREIRPNGIFVAVKGAQSDGHAYVDKALSRRPRACVVRKSFIQSSKLAQENRSCFIEVSDTHLAHRELARLFRDKFKGKIIGIGGSSGKTTAKDFLAQILSTQFKTTKTEKSQNGELGIPRTLEKLGPEFEVGVIEIGIDAPGDMLRHGTIVQPDLAILTSIGEEHLNLLHTIENVFREEKILFDLTLSRGGHCFAPRADLWLRKLTGPSNIHFVDSENKNYKIPLGHPYARQNACLAIAIAEFMGMNPAVIQRGLDQLKIPEGRGVEIKLQTGDVWIADHYNSNPSSLRAGLNYARTRAQGLDLPLRLILGDMLDLGPTTRSLHEALIPDLILAQPREIVFIGPEMSRLSSLLSAQLVGQSPPLRLSTFQNSHQAALSKEISVHALKPALTLLKGSRGMQLEQLLTLLQNHSENQGS